MNGFELSKYSTKDLEKAQFRDSKESKWCRVIIGRDCYHDHHHPGEKKRRTCQGLGSLNNMPEITGQGWGSALAGASQILELSGHAQRSSGFLCPQTGDWALILFVSDTGLLSKDHYHPREQSAAPVGLCTEVGFCVSRCRLWLTCADRHALCAVQSMSQAHPQTLGGALLVCRSPDSIGWGGI